MITAQQVLVDIQNGASFLRREEVVELAERAQRHDPHDLRALIDIAIKLRDYGCWCESKNLCLHILGVDPLYAFALYELAILEAMQGNHVDALLSLEKLLVQNSCDERGLLFAARMSARIGDYQNARVYLDRTDEITPDHPDLPWTRELIVFMQNFPVDVSDRLTRLYEINSRHVATETITGWAATALQAGEGFSLIRLGDGEGAFCRISSKDEELYPNLYKYCREDRANVWFNGEINIYSSGFTKAAFFLRDAVREANVVGMPYRSWVNHEYKFCSPTGIVCLVNALRLGHMNNINRSQSWTSQLVHMELLQTGALEQLVRSHRRVNLISCLSDAATIMKRHFGLDDVKLYRVPGEKLHAAVLGPDTSLGRHYPDRFEELMNELSHPLKGELFLVAAGLLGKFYCNQIKKSGGVALDIGSVVDVWLGKATRPNLDRRLALTGN